MLGLPFGGAAFGQYGYTITVASPSVTSSAGGSRFPFPLLKKRVLVDMPPVLQVVGITGRAKAPLVISTAQPIRALLRAVGPAAPQKLTTAYRVRVRDSVRASVRRPVAVRTMPMQTFEVRACGEAPGAEASLTLLEKLVLVL